MLLSIRFRQPFLALLQVNLANIRQFRAFYLLTEHFESWSDQLMKYLEKYHKEVHILH